MTQSWFDDQLLELHPHTQGNLTASVFAVSQTSSRIISDWFIDKLGMNNSIYASDEVFCQGQSPEDAVVTEFSQPFEESSIPAIFNQIAAGMTSFIRKQGQARLEFNMDLDTLKTFSGEPAQGKSWMIQTQIRVRWEWITFPAALLVLVSFFFVTTALRSNTLKLGIWKSSNIPLLCSGLDQDVQRRLESGSPDLMRLNARNRSCPTDT